jgi:hypothetical protein
LPRRGGQRCAGSSTAIHSSAIPSITERGIVSPGSGGSARAKLATAPRDSSSRRDKWGRLIRRASRRGAGPAARRRWTASLNPLRVRFDEINCTARQDRVRCSELRPGPFFARRLRNDGANPLEAAARTQRGREKCPRVLPARRCLTHRVCSNPACNARH